MNYGTLGCCQATPNPSINWGVNVPTQQFATEANKGKSEMTTIDAKAVATIEAIQPETKDQREYLTAELWGIDTKKDHDLDIQFGIRGKNPKTANELIDVIKNGKFTIKPDMADKRGYDGTEYIIWKDPSIKADYAGLALANEARVKARTTAGRMIKIGSPAEGLSALNAYEAWTYTAPTA